MSDAFVCFKHGEYSHSVTCVICKLEPRAEKAEARIKELEAQMESKQESASKYKCSICGWRWCTCPAKIDQLEGERRLDFNRIKELESERDRYKAALEKIKNLGPIDCPNCRHYDILAREALTVQPEGGPMGARDGSHDSSTTPMGTHTGESFNPAPPEYSVGFVSGEYEHLEREKARMLGAQDKPIECSYCGADFECPGCGRKTNQDK